MNRLPWLLLLVLLWGSSALAKDGPVPAHTGYVTDYAKVLSPDQVGQLNQQLHAIETELADHPQVAILVIRSLKASGSDEAESIKDYANRVFHSWKLGNVAPDGHNLDNGVLVVAAIGDRKVRIETGYGVEPRLPDLAARTIIDDDMKPHLHHGGTDNWFLAFQAAAGDIRQHLQATVADSMTGHEATNSSWSTSTVLLLVFGGVVMLVVLSVRGRRRADDNRVLYVAAAGMASRSGTTDDSSSSDTSSSSDFSGGGGDSGGGGADSSV